MTDADRTEHDARSPQAKLPPLSIVALDDDPDFRELVTSMLEAEGHDAKAVATPEALFAMLEANLPDVVLLDIKMGRHSGEEVLAEIRKRWSGLCVIVVTGYPTLDSMRETFKQQAFDYIAKPFSMEEMRRSLAQAVEKFDLGTRPQDRLRHELGRRVRLARTERGWTLRDLSEATSISVSQLSSIERGAHLPSIESLLAIAGALDQNPSDWFSAAGF